MQETDPDTFLILLEEGLQIMRHDPYTVEFGNYFQNSYVPCKELMGLLSQNSHRFKYQHAPRKNARNNKAHLSPRQKCETPG